jgi:hypothetical protein
LPHSCDLEGDRELGAHRICKSTAKMHNFQAPTMRYRIGRVLGGVWPWARAGCYSSNRRNTMLSVKRRWIGTPYRRPSAELADRTSANLYVACMTSSHERACAQRRHGVVKTGIKAQGVRPADGHNGCHVKTGAFGDLGMSPRQLPHNTACVAGRLVTLITLARNGPDDRTEALCQSLRNA